MPEFERDELRELIVRPYRLIYSISDSQVVILHVIHGARLLGDIPEI